MYRSHDIVFPQFHSEHAGIGQKVMMKRRHGGFNVSVRRTQLQYAVPLYSLVKGNSLAVVQAIKSNLYIYLGTRVDFFHHFH